MLEEPYTSLTDVDIVEVIRQIHAESPNFGVSMMSGILRGRGLKVSRDRLRRLMRENDPIGMASRWPRGAAKRRPYSVPGSEFPLAYW